MTCCTTPEVKELRDRTSSIAINNRTQYTRTWLILTGDKDNGPMAVEAQFVAATGIALGDTYNTGSETDASAVVREVRFNCTSVDGCQWQAVVTYGPWDQDDLNPILRSPNYEWSFAQWSRNVEYDFFGNAITSSANEPYLGGIEIQDSLPVLRVTKNQAVFDISYAAAYKDAVNANPWFGAPRYTVKVSNISGRNTYDQAYGWYWEAEYEFQFKLAGWQEKILDRGYYRLNDEDPQETIRITEGGKPTDVPKSLDGKGKVRDVTATPPVYRTYMLYPVLPFTWSF